MMLDVWDELATMERRLDDLFRVFVAPRARPMFPAMPSGFHRPHLPATDLFIRDGKMVMRMALPGIDPAKDVTITLDDHELIVRGERRFEEETKSEDFFRMEVAYGAFERHFPVPEGIEEKKIVAEYHDGLLEIVVPMPAKASLGRETKAIPVKIAPVKATTVKATKPARTPARRKAA